MQKTIAQNPPTETHLLPLTFLDLLAAGHALILAALIGAVVGMVTGALIGVFYFIIGAFYGAMAGIPTGMLAAIWGAAWGGRRGWAISGALSGIAGGLGITIVLSLMQNFGANYFGTLFFFVLPPAVAGYFIGKKQGRMMTAVGAGQSGGSLEILAKLRQTIYKSPLYRFPMRVRLLLALYQTIALGASLYYLFRSLW